MNDERTPRTFKDEEYEDAPRTEQREKAPKKPKLVPMKVDNCSRVNVRTDPDMDSDILRTIDRGTVVYTDPTFRDESFVSVKLDGNVTGFIKKDFLTAI